jgi:hypothetical protein
VPARPPSDLVYVLALGAFCAFVVWVFFFSR